MSCEKGNFICGLFIGALIGTAAGMLTAPESGKDTRNRIKKDTEDAFGSVYDQAAEYGDSMKKQFDEFADGINEKINQYKMQIENKIQEIQDEVNQDIADLNEELLEEHGPPDDHPVPGTALSGPVAGGAPLTGVTISGIFLHDLE